jgi:hypothetical protein
MARWGRRAGLAVFSLLLTTQGAAADRLSELFPPGVPGYGDEPGVTVGSRLHPEQASPGIRAGAFMLRPLLETSLGYDSNVLGDGAGSVVIGTRPSLRASSDWSRHAVGVYVSADDRRYPGTAGQGRTDLTLSAGGSLDVGRDRLTIAVAHLGLHQDATQLDALSFDRPVAFTVEDARASYAAGFGRWKLEPALEAAAWRFGSASVLGASVSQSYRDRDVVRGGVTLRYELAPLRELVMLARATGQDYLHTTPGVAAPNSMSYELLAGIDYADSVWRYRLLAGGETRQFSAAAYQPHTAVVLEAGLTWTPTGLTTVNAIALRSIEDAAQEGVAGYTYTAARLAIDHEYRRDIILHGAAGLQHAAFLDGGGGQTLYVFSAGATWVVNRNLRVSATYDLSLRRGVAPGGPPEYVRNVALVSAAFGL